MKKLSKIGLTILIMIGYMLLFGIFPLSILLCGYTIKLIKKVWAKDENNGSEIDNETNVEPITLDKNE